MALPGSADPIVAVATPAGRGAVGIVRVSGSALGPLIQALCGQPLTPRQAHYLPFLDGHGQAIDQGLALYFPAPHSFTGEDVLELQAHGGPVVLQLLLERCLAAARQVPIADASAQPSALARLRLAQPGEFTQRAFLNGKLDLAQAEAVADLIDAGTAQAARSATRSLTGAFSNEVHQLKSQLEDLRIWVEASIDFPEEEIDFLAQTKLKDRITLLIQQHAGVMAKTRQGALLREGMTVVIAGQPNAGKSSLLNALAGADLAIVTPIAGTTRDKIQQTIQIEGVALHIVDTAGLRHSDDAVEQIGIARAWEEIAKADAVLFLHDLTKWASKDQQEAMQYKAEDALIADQLGKLLPKGVGVLHLWNKLDALSAGLLEHSLLPAGLVMSAKTGEGLAALKQTLLAMAGWQSGMEGTYIARERHVQALAQVEEHLLAAQLHLDAIAQLDLAAESLRLAQQALGAITGELTPDDLLGLIFSNFCIGK
jgi:tRNA modification GTPase